ERILRWVSWRGDKQRRGWMSSRACLMFGAVRMSTKLSRKSLQRLAGLITLDRLEDRCLFSVAHHGVVNSIAFSLAPASVQAGLDALASTDSLPAPAATDAVYLGNVR